MNEELYLDENFISEQISSESENISNTDCDCSEEYETTEKADFPEEENIDTLKKEIESLKAQLSALEAERNTQNKLLQEVSSFKELFPDVELDDIPQSVWEQVKNGTPLNASYALYEKRLKAEEARIAKINASNALSSPGIAGKDTANEYFSPEDVRKMSPSEVHANYAKIKQSMKKWM